MPCLQLDAPGPYDPALKRRLARRIGDSYARIMQTTPEQVSVVIRELGEGNVWRSGKGEPEPAAVLHCDIRLGRPMAQRLELAEALVAICSELLALRPDRLAVIFTQHEAAEMYKQEQGGFSTDWSRKERGETD